MDQYMALSKKDLQINITMNELYNTHSLLVQHVEVLVSCANCLISIDGQRAEIRYTGAERQVTSSYTARRARYIARTSSEER